MRKRIALARAFLNECSWTVGKTLCSVEGELHDIESGQSGLDDGPLDISCDNASSFVRLLSWIVAAPERLFSSVPAFDEVRDANWSRSK